MYLLSKRSGQFKANSLQYSSVPMNLLDENYKGIVIDGSLTDGYQDYQDALNQDLENEKDNADAVGLINVGQLEGVTDEQIEANAIDKILANEYDIAGVGVDVYENTAVAEEETDSEKAPTVAEMDSNIVIIDGLEDFFPFCIPFDLYELIQEFNTPAVTPKFTYTIGFGGLFDSEDIEIDLTPFDTVAQVFRIMMAIGFAVFLIIKTRDLIRGDFFGI